MPNQREKHGKWIPVLTPQNDMSVSASTEGAASLPFQFSQQLGNFLTFARSKGDLAKASKVGGLATR